MKHLIILACLSLSVAASAQTNEITTLEPSQYQSRRGMGINRCGGSGHGNTLYIIDGVQVQNIGKARVEQEAKIPLLPAIPNTLVFTRKDIIAMPTTYTRDIVAFAPTVYQVRRGEDIRVAGSRANDILYVVDGMQIPRN